VQSHCFLAKIEHFYTSATKVRDIGGFKLGVHLREINRISPVSHLAFDTYKTTRNDIEYEFSVTPLGRVYAIESNQELGQFTESIKFAKTFIAKLTTKYGEPTRNQPGIATANWDLFQNVESSQGIVVNTSVNWMAASLMLGESGKKLNIHMVDYRLLRQDKQRLNCKPAKQAQDKITF